MLIFLWNLLLLARRRTFLLFAQLVKLVLMLLFLFHFMTMLLLQTRLHHVNALKLFFELFHLTMLLHQDRLHLFVILLGLFFVKPKLLFKLLELLAKSFVIFVSFSYLFRIFGFWGILFENNLWCVLRKVARLQADLYQLIFDLAIRIVVSLP